VIYFAINVKPTRNDNTYPGSKVNFLTDRWVWAYETTKSDRWVNTGYFGFLPQEPNHQCQRERFI